MSIGAFGENFPYTNFHNMNLDWIIETVKDFHEKYTNIEETINTGEETITEATETGLEEINTARVEAISEITDITEGHRRRFIILGDSYGDRLSSSGLNYYQHLINNGTLRTDNSYFAHAPGAGFYHANEDYTFKHLLETLTVTEPQTITDIIIQCGANDNFHTYEQVTNSMRDFYTYAHNTFPLARVKLFACGLTMTPSAFYDRENSTFVAFRESATFGFELIPNSESVLCNTVYLETDRCHPNQYGVSQLVWSLAQAIRTGYCDTRHRLYTAQMNAVASITGALTPSSAILGAQFLSGLYCYTDNDKMKMVTSEPIAIAFNLYNVTLTPDNRIVITIDNIAGLPTAPFTRTCTLVRGGSTVEQGSDALATFEYGYNSETNKYTITIRPRETFNTGTSNEIVYIYLNDTIEM